MLVDDLKESQCKSSAELHSRMSVLLQENNYSNADLEHALDWLAKSMVSMEKTFNRVKHEKTVCRESLINVKEAYEANLKNNQTLSNEAKGFAYNLWRYNKKKEYLVKILDEIKKYSFPFFSQRGKRIKNMIKDMEDKFANYDTLIDVNMDDVDKKIKKYMERPVIFDAKKISKEEFEKLTTRG